MEGIEIRNSKFEIRNKSKSPKFETEREKRGLFWKLRHLSFEIVSSFDIRVSSFRDARKVLDTSEEEAI